MKYLLVVLGLSLCAISFRAGAQTSEDILNMANKGVGEDVLIASIEASKTGFELDAGMILKLKEAKVSDKVLQAMLKHKPRAEAPLAERPQIDVAPAKDGKEAAGEGTLNIENIDDKSWAYMYEPDAKTIWITGSKDGKGNLAAHGGVNLRMAAGTYKVRYNGKDAGPSVTVRSGEKSLLMLSRVQTDEVEALYVSVFENGDRKGGGKLIQFSDSAAPKAGKRSDIGTDDDREYADAPSERIVEVPQTTVVYRDSYVQPTVIYDTYPRYYSYSPRYYSYPRYSSGFSFGFGYSSGHRHSHYHRGGSYYGFGSGYRGSGSGYRSSGSGYRSR